ncbi:MAG: hypothetical protein IKT12_01385, partial [Thermoguttaceae bacterium]|nr:hypothetical protein [Thermoguttaceae bacterium]
PTVTDVLRNNLLNWYRRSDDYQNDIDAAVAQYDADYYQAYYAMEFDSLTEAYREKMIAKCADAAELDAAMAAVASDTPENRAAMAEFLAKDALSADYREHCYDTLAKEVEEANQQADSRLQAYADTFVSKYKAYYAMAYSDLLKTYIDYYIDAFNVTEQEAVEEVYKYYSEETESHRVWMSCDMAGYYTQQTTGYDSTKAGTFNQAFESSIYYSLTPVTPEEAAESAIETVKKTYEDTMYLSVDLLALAWQVDSATLDEVVAALARDVVELKYEALADEQVEVTVSNIIYNAVHTYTGDVFEMNDYSLLDGQTSEIKVDVDIPALFDGIFTKWFTWNETAQVKDVIRAQYETAWFNEERPAVEEAEHDAYREELISRYTDADGNVDEWSLEQAVQKAIDAETTKEVDDRITVEAESLINPAHVADLVDLSMAEETPILDQTVTVNLGEINASTKAIVAVLLDGEIETEAWGLVDTETDRLISLRVTHDMGVWESGSSSEAEKEEIEDKANSVLSGHTVRELAAQDVIDCENYADDAIHKEVQSSIIYDGLYSNFWNRYSETYREEFGKEWSYLDLASDDESTFQANEFSHWFGMTYADICAYLTEAYTSQYPELSEAEIQDKVKGEMIDWVLLPDKIHALTMEQIDYASGLVMYSDIYKEMYEKYDESTRETIYDGIHDSSYEFYYDRLHDELHDEFYPDAYTEATAKVTELINSTYADEVAKAAEEAGMSTDDYVEQVVQNLDNGVQPEWLPEGTTLPSPKELAETETENKIRLLVNSLIRGTAESMVPSSGYIDGYTQAKIDELIEEKIYDLIDSDPVFIAKKADIIGRANAVMEYNLQYLRGEGNGIYFTTYTAAFEETDGGAGYSNGIVNARRDGNNQKYYIGIPRTHISGGTLVVDAVWEGNRGDTETMSISIGAAVKTDDGVSILDVDNTIKAIINAFTNAAGQLANWQDGMFDSVQVVDVSDRQSLYEGTDWDWKNYENVVSGSSIPDSISGSTYWKDDYVIFEVTFQGGAHDSVVDLTFNDDSSTLAYQIDNDYYDVLTALNDNASVKIDDVDIELTARVHDLIATRVSGSVYYDDCMSVLSKLYSGLDGESTFGELVAELYTGDKTKTTAVFNIAQRATNNINYGQYDFYQDIKALLDDEIVREGNSPHLYEILTFITNGTYADATFANFYNLFRHFYVPRQEGEDPISHSTVINAENEVSWDNDSWLSDVVGKAYTDLNDLLNPDADV